MVAVALATLVHAAAVLLWSLLGRRRRGGGSVIVIAEELTDHVHFLKSEGLCRATINNTYDFSSLIATNSSTPIMYLLRCDFGLEV